jgi:hypothetical protein
VYNYYSVIVEILPSIPKENINFVLKNILASYLSGNPLIHCPVHGKILCETLITKLGPPVIVNFYNLHSQKNRKISINVNTKKMLKLN